MGVGNSVEWKPRGRSENCDAAGQDVHLRGLQGFIRVWGFLV